MARRAVRQLQHSDFSGGLNYRDDSFELAQNELADAVNMRVLPGGRIETRKSAHYVNSTALNNAPKNIWSFCANNVQQIVVQDNNDAAYGTGGNFTAINPDALATTGIMRAAVMHRVGTASSERLYVQRNAEQVAWKWDGAAATVLAAAEGAYNANLAAPAGGRMPTARYITTHAGFMFHAYTVETGVTYKNRVRWSHPGEPEDYRSTDYIDVGADDGDVVTGLASMGGTLFIFKARSVWMLTGYDSSTWQLQRIVDGVGAVSQEAIAVGPGAVYFFDQAKGVFALGGHKSTTSTASQLSWLWPKLVTKLDDNTIPYTYVSTVVVDWMDNRLWVAVPWEGQSSPTRVFVYDPQCSKEGAWYAYEYGNVVFGALGLGAYTVGPMLEWSPPGAQTRLFACTGGTLVLELDYDSTGTDTFTSGGLFPTSTFTTVFRTAWVTAGSPGVKKRWRRPTYIFDADQAATVGVEVYTDFSMVASTRSQQLTVGTVSGAGTNWGALNWNAFYWGPGPEGDETLVRGTAFGNAYAVQLRFEGTYNTHWGLHGIDFRFIPQRIR